MLHFVTVATPLRERWRQDAEEHTFFPLFFPLLFQPDAAHSWWVVQGQPGKPSAPVKPCPELLGSLILSDVPIRMY